MDWMTLAGFAGIFLVGAVVGYWTAAKDAERKKNV